jgi:hypothetical protein
LISWIQSVPLGTFVPELGMQVRTQAYEFGKNRQSGTKWESIQENRTVSWPDRPLCFVALDDTLRPGDVVATKDGLVAYSGMGINDPTPEFTPVSSFPGLTPQLRARLNNVKVAPAREEMATNTAATPLVIRIPPAANDKTKGSQSCQAFRQRASASDRGH